MKRKKSIHLNLPIPLQESIAKCVAMARDYMNFRVACRKWKFLLPPCRWSCINSARSCTAIPNPWLMFFQQEKYTFHFCDPRENVTYHKKMATKLYRDCVIQCAKDGCLVVSQGERSKFFFESFTNTRIQPPDLPVYYCMNDICFSASPIYPKDY